MFLDSEERRSIIRGYVEKTAKNGMRKRRIEGDINRLERFLLRIAKNPMKSIQKMKSGYAFVARYGGVGKLRYLSYTMFGEQYETSLFEHYGKVEGKYSERLQRHIKTVADNNYHISSGRRTHPDTYTLGGPKKVEEFAKALYPDPKRPISIRSPHITKMDKAKLLSGVPRYAEKHLPKRSNWKRQD